MKILLLQPGPAKLDLFGDVCGHSVTRVGAGEKTGWRHFFRLLRQFQEDPPELVLVTQREFCCLPPRAGWLQGGLAFLQCFGKNPVDFFILCFFAQAVRKQLPIALINRSDNGRLLPGSDWFYRRSHACFVRELHPQPEIALQHLYTPTGGNPQTNRRARKVLSWIDPACPAHRDLEKLRPISLGVLPESLLQIRPRPIKEWDVFFAGDLHEKGLRGKLVEELRALSSRAGWKILLKERMPLPEYLQTVASSWLCLSPPGMGWDCWRHYEAMLAGSIPLMTYPVIYQHKAAVDGEHCFYFSPDRGGLTRCLEKIMAHRELFPKIAQSARELVLQEHTFAKLEEYVIRETLAAHSMAKA